MEDPKRMEEGYSHDMSVSREKPKPIVDEQIENERKLATETHEETKGDEKPILVKEKSERIATLDAFRGLTIVLMILVDDAGGVYERIDHSPWNGCTLADFVMPFSLFIVGAAIALALKRVSSMKYAVRKIIIRTLKMLFWGILLQGGYSHAPHELVYGIDMKIIRWCGILQRIAMVYMIVALTETLTTKLRPTVIQPGYFSIFSAYRWQWLGGFIAFLIYMITTFAVYVPNWSFTLNDDGKSETFIVECGMRGHLGPACNAVGYVDREVWGINHLYSQPVWSRLKTCTLASPKTGDLRPDAPSWCRAPFEPEGLLRFLFCNSISAILSGVIDIHYGHVLIHFKGHAERLKQWVSMGFGLMIIAIILHFTDAIPINKQLYSFSYVCFTAGAAGLVFSAFYILIDVWGKRTPFLLFEWIGMNAMLVFVLGAQGILAGFINGWYYKNPDNNLVNWIQDHVFIDVWNSERLGTLLYVIFAEIVFWGVLSGILHKLLIYWKL